MLLHPSPLDNHFECRPSLPNVFIGAFLLSTVGVMRGPMSMDPCRFIITEWVTELNATWLAGAETDSGFH